MLLHPGVVDEDIQAAHLLDRLLDQPLAFGDHADIGRDEAGTPALRADLFEGLPNVVVIVPPVDDQISPRLGQAYGDTATDALRATGNQCNLVVQIHRKPHVAVGAQRRP